MSERSKYEPGEFCWVDLMAHDMEKAGLFYEALFGWTTQPQDTGGGPPYSIFQFGGKQVAGMGQMPPEVREQGAPPAWNSYLNVADVDKAVETTTRLGGAVMMPPMQVHDAGRMAIITDPTGAAVSLWEKHQHLGAELVNEVGCFCWNELATRDMAAAKAFFGELCGWSFERNEHSPSEYYFIKQGDRMAGGMIAMTEEWGEIPPHWSVYFTVADINGACERVSDLGGSVMAQPFDAPPAGKIAVVADPQSAAFDLIEMSVAPD